MNDQQSPFLKLPAEIRLMVYDKLFVTRHHALQASSDCLSNVHLPTLPYQFVWPLNIKHVSKTFTCSILATCRLIHNEARHLPSLPPTRFLVEHDCNFLEKALFLEHILHKSPNYPDTWAANINWYKVHCGYNLDASSTDIFIARALSSIFRPPATPPPEVVVFINNFKRTPGTDLPEDPYQFTAFIAIVRDAFSRRTGDLTIMWRPKPDVDDVLSCGYRNGVWFDDRKSELSESPKRVTRRQWVEEWGED